MTVIEYNGKQCKIEKRDFFCKAGAYDSKYKRGWVLVSDGVVVLGNNIDMGSICDGAARHEKPQFPTRKSLIEYVENE